MTLQEVIQIRANYDSFIENYRRETLQFFEDITINVIGVIPNIRFENFEIGVEFHVVNDKRPDELKVVYAWLFCDEKAEDDFQVKFKVHIHGKYKKGLFIPKKKNVGFPGQKPYAIYSVIGENEELLYILTDEYVDNKYEPDPNEDNVYTIMREGNSFMESLFLDLINDEINY
jgi:hypothetical protein